MFYLIGYYIKWNQLYNETALFHFAEIPIKKRWIQRNLIYHISPQLIPIVPRFYGSWCAGAVLFHHLTIYVLFMCHWKLYISKWVNKWVNNYVNIQYKWVNKCVNMLRNVVGLCKSVWLFKLVYLLTSILLFKDNLWQYPYTINPWSSSYCQYNEEASRVSGNFKVNASDFL